jgi:hypothetical protein
MREGAALHACDQELVLTGIISSGEGSGPSLSFCCKSPSDTLQAALHEDEEPIQMVTVPDNQRHHIIRDELTFQPHHVTYDDTMFPSGSTTAISAVSEGLAHRQDTLDEDSNEAAASMEEETISAEEMEADEVSLVKRCINDKEVVQVPAVCRGCGAPVLSQAAIDGSCTLGRTPNNSPSELHPVTPGCLCHAAAAAASSTCNLQALPAALCQ